MVRSFWARLAGAILAAAPASALCADDALEGRAFYKVFGVGLRMPGGLVEGTSALAALIGADGIPAWGAMTAHTARAEASWSRGEWLQVTAAWQVEGVVASHPAFAGGASLTTSLASPAEGARRRLWDFDPVLLDEPGVRVHHNLDRLAARFATPWADVVVGRQVLSWGTGRLWNPTDLLSPFSPTEIDREVRRGIDALRVSVPLARAAQLELIWLPQTIGQLNGGAARGQFNAGGFDFSASIAKYARDVVFGADFAGDVGPIGVHGEAAYTLGLHGVAAPGPIGVAERALRAVVGADARIGEKTAVTIEYHYNGWGAEDSSGYLRALSSERVQRGEVFGAGRHYLGLVGSYQVTDLLSAQAIALVNVTDPSAQVMPVVEYWFAQSVILRAGAFVPIGERPDPSELQALTAEDVLTRSERYQSATSTLGLRSEYGTSPAGVFAQVGVYFQ